MNSSVPPTTSFLPEKQSILARASGSDLAIMPSGEEQIPLGSGIITGLLGAGGMARVYEIWNGRLEVYRAVKLFNPNCGERALQRFETEIKISAKLHHRNIIDVYSVGTWHGLPYLEMEKIQGMSLDKLIETRGALPPEACTSIAIMMARALRYAHSQEYALYGVTYHGIIHRDIKPANIFLCENGVAKLMDFGIASPTDASLHTIQGELIGTLQYQSPELLLGTHVDARTDLYSLAATLYEALTGARAFPEINFAKLSLDKMRGNVKTLDEFALPIPPALRQLVTRCMSHDAEKRPESAAVLLEKLPPIHRRLTPLSPELVVRRLLSMPLGEKQIVATRAASPRRFALAAVSITLAVLVILGAVLLMRSHRGAGAPARAAGVSPSRPSAGETTRSLAQSAPPSAPQQNQPSLGVKQPRFSSESTHAGSIGVPATERPAQPAKAKSRLQLLKEHYGTDDLLALMVSLHRDKDYANILRVFDSLTPEQARLAQPVILEIRSLNKTGATQRMAQLVGTSTIEDGEIWLTKSELAFKAGDVAECRRLLDKSSSMPRALMTYDEFKHEEQHLRALCSSAEFDRDPTEANYKAAIESWYQLESLIRAFPNHPYLDQITREKQRIRDKLHDRKG